MGAVEEIEELKRDVAARTRARATADGELTRAEARQEAALAALAEEFGVDGAEGARQLDDQIEAELAADAARVRELLAESGSQA